MNLRTFDYKKDKATKPRGIVILLHGYGSNGSDLISLAPELDRLCEGLVYVSPDAPNDWEGGMEGGYQWYSLMDRSDQAMLREANKIFPIIADFVDEQLKKYDLTEDQLVIAGFSQGGMLSLHSASYLNVQTKGALSFSGYMIPSGFKAKPTLKNTSFQLTHGNMDDIVPYGAMKKAIEFLETQGIKANSYTANGLGHGIDYGCVKNGGKFLKELFG